MGNVNKTVNREDVETLARVIRKYANTGDADFLGAKHFASEKLASQSYGLKHMHWAFEYLFSALCGIDNLCNASDDLICQVLELIGIHVVDENENEKKGESNA